MIRRVIKKAGAVLLAAGLSIGMLSPSVSAAVKINKTVPMKAAKNVEPEEWNREELTEFLKEIKKNYPEKTIWLYTGYEWKDIKNMDIVNYLDVLVDGEFEVEKKELDLHWKGSANQMVINVPETLGKGEIVLHEENC